MRLFTCLVTVCIAVFALIDPAFADTAAVIPAGNELPKFGSVIGLGIAAAGGALGQGRIMGSTVESIARNPGAASQLFVPWILGVIFVESLVIYSLVAFFLI